MRKSVLPLLILGAVMIGPATPALAAPVPITSHHDGRCLDEDNSRPLGNGSKAQVWQCLGGLNQQWTYYHDRTIRSSADGRCLDLDTTGGTHNGSAVRLWACHKGWANQQWYRNANGTIVSVLDNRCLDEDTAGGTHDGSRVQVWTCNGWLNQKWHF